MSTSDQEQRLPQLRDPADRPRRYWGVPADGQFCYVELKRIDLRAGNRSVGGIEPSALGELRESIKVEGMLQPVLLEPGDDGRYTVVAGERRIRASRDLGRAAVPAIVLRKIGVGHAEMASLAENIHRVGLHPLDESDAIARLVSYEMLDFDAPGIARRYGRPADYIYRRLRLQRLTDDLRQALAAGRITVVGAETCALLPADHQMRVMERIRQLPASAHVTTETLGWWIEEATDLLDAAPFDISDSQLVEDAGSCLECPLRIVTQGSLFDDQAAGDRCGSRPCWKAKVAAHVEQVRSQLAPVHMETSVDGSSEEKDGVLGRWDWEQVSQDDGGRPILHIDGPKAGEVEYGLPRSEVEAARDQLRADQNTEYRARLSRRKDLFRAICRHTERIAEHDLITTLSEMVPAVLSHALGRYRSLELFGDYLALPVGVDDADYKVREEREGMIKAMVLRASQTSGDSAALRVLIMYLATLLDDLDEQEDEDTCSMAAVAARIEARVQPQNGAAVEVSPTIWTQSLPSPPASA